MELRFVISSSSGDKQLPVIGRKLIARICKHTIGSSRLESIISMGSPGDHNSCLMLFQDDWGALSSLATDVSAEVAFKIALYKLENRLASRKAAELR